MVRHERRVGNFKISTGTKLENAREVKIFVHNIKVSKMIIFRNSKSYLNFYSSIVLNTKNHDYIFISLHINRKQ